MGCCRTLEFNNRQEAVGALLSALGPDGQHATIAKFIQNELDAEREKVTLPHQQGSQHTELLREHSAQQFELLRQQRATATGSTYTRRPKTPKIDISKYKGANEDSLLRWFVELEDVIRARHIVDEDKHIAFAQSNLAGRSKTWALGLQLYDPYVFESLEVFKSLLRQTFEPPQAEFRARSELLRIKQGKRDVHSYIQYIRHLTSCIRVDLLNQQTLITLFMQGLTDGPVKTYLFRLEFNTLEEAIRFVEQENFSVKQAHANSNSYHRRDDRRMEAQNQ